MFEHGQWTALLLTTTLTLTLGSDLAFRLRSGKRFNEGILQIYTDQGWGSVCDAGRATWSKQEGDLVCRSLGFPGSLTTVHGSSEIADIPPDTKTVTESIDCDHSDTIQECKIKYRGDCPIIDVVSVRCMVESGSGCKFGEVAALGSCFRLVADPKTFVDAENVCKLLGSDLVEIQDTTENIVVGMLVDHLAAGLPQFWTGGVVSRILDASYSFWHGSQKKIEFLNNLVPSLANNERQGVTFSPSPGIMAAWKTVDFETKLPFICQSKQSATGCLVEDDPEGSKYAGPAARDEQGRKCIPWNTAGLGPQFVDTSHNYCRNPDGEYSPYCYVDMTGEPSPCHIPRCSQVQLRSSNPDVCPTIISNNIQDSCEPEEWQCKDGPCIYKGHVCDGEADCSGGEDEFNCRRLTSLFVKETGFSAKEEDDKSSFQATEEECARRCIYNKGPCSSFSHRPGKDGKADKCSLGSQKGLLDMDTLVEKKSWNYFYINNTEKNRRGVGNQQPIIQGLRLRRVKKIKADLVEVLVDGEWGGICDDGFTITEGDVLCHQQGFKLGAEKVVKEAGRAKETKIRLHGLKCTGSEESVSQCLMEKGVPADCPASQAVGVVCREVEKVCEDDQFHCASGECINIDNLCDDLSGRGHCKDDSDEDPLYCNSRTQVQLVPMGESFNSGRLEIRHKGIWGTVCSEFFSQDIANIFCRMLGFDGNSTFEEISTLHQKEGSWPVWISLPKESFCKGDEETIEDCHDPELWTHINDCSHFEDVQLTCADDNTKIDVVTLDTPPPARAKIDFDTRQIVENCGFRSEGGMSGRDPRARTEAMPRVAGGKSVPHGSIPWQASIRLRGPSGSTFHHCGAVIISPFHVLTTAHCLWDYRNKLDIYYVRVGDNVIEVEDAGEAELVWRGWTSTTASTWARTSTTILP